MWKIAPSAPRSIFSTLEATHAKNAQRRVLGRMPLRRIYSRRENAQTITIDSVPFAMELLANPENIIQGAPVETRYSLRVDVEAAPMLPLQMLGTSNLS